MPTYKYVHECRYHLMVNFSTTWSRECSTKNHVMTEDIFEISFSQLTSILRGGLVGWRRQEGPLRRLRLRVRAQRGSHCNNSPVLFAHHTTFSRVPHIPHGTSPLDLVTKSPKANVRSRYIFTSIRSHKYSTFKFRNTFNLCKI